MSLHPAPFLLSGSFAYDTILNHPGPFHQRILPEAVHRLNVSFDVQRVHEEFGGTGGNIAYNAGLLGMHPLLIGSVGHDGERYLSHLLDQGHDPSTLTKHTVEPTPHAWILTDQHSNQITSFNPGTLKRVRPSLTPQTPSIWHLSPENPMTTAALAARALAEHKIYFFDPGQALPDFLDGKTDPLLGLRQIVSGAAGIFLNDYEATILENWADAPLLSLLTREDQFFVRTKGGAGLEIIERHSTTVLPVAVAAAIVDPTGCGDAFRAGFLYGYSRGWALSNSAALGAIMGSFAIEHPGGQNHRPNSDEIWSRYATYLEANQIRAAA